MHVLKKTTEFWHRRSLKFWLAMGMLMTYCPILLSAVIGYFLHHQTIIRPLVEVSSKQRDVLQPLQSVRVSLWDVSNSLVDYAIDGEGRRVTAYNQRAEEIDSEFASLLAAVQGDFEENRDVNRALSSWQEITALSNDILSRPPLKVDLKAAQNIEELEAKLNLLGHSLGAVYEDVRVENEQTHKQALVDLVNSERFIISGFVASIVFGVLGVVVINRSLVSSMNELATGAMRLAGGDRDHHIKVHIPHELASVADAFNQMTNQILQQEEALSHAATTDGLTGVLNRRESDRILADEILRGNRYGTPFSVIMGDIDNFKAFNDTYGHQGGDQTLCAVAETLQNDVRELDKVCRYGGEEFLLILKECDAETARQTAERLRAAVEARNVLLNGVEPANVTISLGVATFPINGTSPELLLKSADAALYKSKENGRNQVTSAIASLERIEAKKFPQDDASNMSTSI